jgi:hypothetical protein
LRLRLVALDAIAAASLLAAVLLVPAGETSRAFALLAIVATVLPGLLLTGEVKRLVAGVNPDVGALLRKAGWAAALNLPLTAAAALVLDLRVPVPILAAFVLVAAAGSAAQACTSIWYYARQAQGALVYAKAVSAGVRVVLVLAAIALRELAWALIGLPLAALAEFVLNRHALAERVTSPATQDTRTRLSPLGVAYAATRAVLAGVKLALEQLIGPLIATFLLIEQLVGGLNAVFEKYFARTRRGRGAVRMVKTGYALLMMPALPTLVHTDFAPGSRWALAVLATVAVAGLLPLSEMFHALQHRSELAVALVSMVLAGVFAAVLGTTWLCGGPIGQAALASYVLWPVATFVFYWIAGTTHARDDTQR